MNPALIIRNEMDADVLPITEVTISAFNTLGICDHTEQFIIEALPSAKALIEEGLSRLKNWGAKGCCLVGHPQYYRKFGVVNVAGLVLEGVPQEVFFLLQFDGRFPRRNVTFHKGFEI